MLRNSHGNPQRHHYLTMLVCVLLIAACSPEPELDRLAEVDGEEAIFSDLRARLYMTEDDARLAYESALTLCPD